MSRLYAVADKQKSNQQQAREAVQAYREKQDSAPGGLIVGERFWHRGWPPEVVLAFLAAPVIRPEKGEIQRKLYARLS